MLATQTNMHTHTTMEYECSSNNMSPLTGLPCYVPPSIWYLQLNLLLLLLSQHYPIPDIKPNKKTSMPTIPKDPKYSFKKCPTPSK